MRDREMRHMWRILFRPGPAQRRCGIPRRRVRDFPAPMSLRIGLSSTPSIFATRRLLASQAEAHSRGALSRAISRAASRL
jgi:hypothetical protein